MAFGVLCLLVIQPWIALAVRRGLANARMPIGSGYVERAERPGAFSALLGFYGIAFVSMAFMGLDLAFGIIR